MQAWNIWIFSDQGPRLGELGFWQVVRTQQVAGLGRAGDMCRSKDGL